MKLVSKANSYEADILLKFVKKRKL